MSYSSDNETGVNSSGFYPNFPLKFLAASSIIDEKVYGKNDDHLGHVKDFMLDIRTGNITYYVVEFGGFLGIGIKYFAIPFSLLKIDTDKKVFRFNQTKEELEKAPGFDIDHWPDTNIHLEEINSYWSFTGREDSF
jgi:sporulation protein YlmC with PRC-barrel domain